VEGVRNRVRQIIGFFCSIAIGFVILTTGAAALQEECSQELAFSATLTKVSKSLTYFITIRNESQPAIVLDRFGLGSFWTIEQYNSHRWEVIYAAGVARGVPSGRHQTPPNGPQGDDRIVLRAGDSFSVQSEISPDLLKEIAAARASNRAKLRIRFFLKSPCNADAIASFPQRALND